MAEGSSSAGRTGSSRRYADWRLERVQKPDGRYLLYYSWPKAGEGPDERRDV